MILISRNWSFWCGPDVLSLNTGLAATSVSYLAGFIALACRRTSTDCVLRAMLVDCTPLAAFDGNAQGQDQAMRQANCVFNKTWLTGQHVQVMLYKICVDVHNEHTVMLVSSHADLVLISRCG
jgi:hypothetical protein